MKTIKLIFISVFLSLFAIGQNLIEVQNKVMDQNGYFNIVIYGYHTHFHSADSLTVTIGNGMDSISFVPTFISWNENYIELFGSSYFNNSGYYDLWVENSLDGKMLIKNAIIVRPDNVNANISSVDFFTLGLDTTVEVNVNGSNTHFVSGTNSQVYYINYQKDTVIPYSIIPLSEGVISCFVHIDSLCGGYYDMIISNDSDGVMLYENALRILNKDKIQIDSISPDSVNNIQPWLMMAYGNLTHFQADTNVVYGNVFYSDAYINPTAINDTVLEFHSNFPTPVKHAFNPNDIIKIYNPIDGLMKYPLRVDLYGSIEDQRAKFKNLSIFPNPAKEYVIISSEEFVPNSRIRLAFYNMLGQLVLKKELNNNGEIKVHLNQLSTGSYYVFVENNEKSKWLKLIKTD